jgi:hypothetical protein
MEEQPLNPPPQGPYTEPTQQNLPNSTPVLVLGILSIVFSCWYFSIIGVVLGIIALVLSGRDLALYQTNPQKYTLGSFNNVKAGRTCAIIGLSVAVLFFIIVMLVIFGILASMPFWGMMD